MTWGWFCGAEWTPGANRPAGDWIAPLIAFVVLLAVAAVVIAV